MVDDVGGAALVEELELAEELFVDGGVGRGGDDLHQQQRHTLLSADS